jgi:hypothetical protein
MEDTVRWIVQLAVVIGIFYIGYKQTKRYREDDKKEAVEEKHRASIKDSIEKLKEDIFFMFDNHGHDIICDNKDCNKPTTGKVFIIPPQQNRRATDRT